MVEDNGSMLIGFLVGFFLGCIGLVAALVMGKADTKKGAVIGFLVEIGLLTCLSFTGVGLNFVLGG